MGAAYLKGPMVVPDDRKPGCTGKVQYESRPEAMIAIKNIRSSRARPYTCAYCGKWHIGRGKYGA